LAKFHASDCRTVSRDRDRYKEERERERERERGGKGGREKEERSACSSLRYIGATI